MSDQHTAAAIGQGAALLDDRTARELRSGLEAANAQRLIEQDAYLSRIADASATGAGGPRRISAGAALGLILGTASVVTGLMIAMAPAHVTGPVPVAASAPGSAELEARIATLRARAAADHARAAALEAETARLRAAARSAGPIAAQPVERSRTTGRALARNEPRSGRSSVAAGGDITQALDGANDPITQVGMEGGTRRRR